MRRCYTRVTALGRVVPRADDAAALRDFILLMLYEPATMFGGRPTPLLLQSIANVGGLDLAAVRATCEALRAEGLVELSESDGAPAAALTETGGIYVELLPGRDPDAD